MLKPASPPTWLIILTAAFTLLILMMAVAETTLWTHYFIDQGEYVSVAGLAFILAAGIYLRRQQRLWVSLPLAVPWLIYPVVTQGDQIIDNLTINQMRLVVHVILAVLFAAPLVILLLAVHHFLRPGIRGLRYLALVLVLSELWVAWAYLGALMILTVILTSIPLLLYLWRQSDAVPSPFTAVRSERLAFRLLSVGVIISFVLYVGFKNRPGAYQGSPSAYNDPSQKDALYEIARISIPAFDTKLSSVQIPPELHSILDNYGEALKTLGSGYYILDRNYNYAFHNALFIRHTPLLPDFRRKGLELIEKARQLARQADARLEAVRPAISAATPLMALVDEIHSYVDYNLKRAKLLEEMSAGFERTQAGLQHATHLYEGENKMMGVVLNKIVEKHRAILETPDVRPVAGLFIEDSREVYQAYANRIVGF